MSRQPRVAPLLRSAWLIAAPWIVLLTPGLGGAQEVFTVNSFESEDELASWQITCAGTRLVQEGVTHGHHALEMTFDPNGEWAAVSMYWNRVVRDWSPYDALVIDVLNPNDGPISGYELVADEAWRDSGGSYWNRHNGNVTFAPGRGQWVIPVRGLYRGEAGSRNNDIKTDIDPARIVRLDLNFGSRGQTGRIVIDHIRFVKASRPASVQAFDFGPPSQPVMLGWTPVSHETAYTAEQGYGWGPQGGAPWDGADRDTTFGTMLTQDFCEAGGYRFHVDVPPGQYEALVIFENCGYWGGEQARCSERSISADGELAWSERRPHGRSTALFRFEDVEPLGRDLWTTYMAEEITRPVRFTVAAGADGITLGFASDAPWGAKLSALALYPSADAAAREWVDGQWKAVENEFRAKAVCLDAPGPAFDAPREWVPLGLVAWPVSLDDDLSPSAVPEAPVGPGDLKLQRHAMRGEFEPFCLALRPQQDLGRCALSIEPDGPALPATASVVWYNTSRDFGSMAYHVVPHTLRPQDAIDLPAGITREVVVTVHVPEDAAPGEYRFRLRLRTPGGRELLSVPLSLTVHDELLDRTTDFQMGFFGLEPPEGLLPPGAGPEALEQTLALLRDHGMNSLSGGPNWRLTGWVGGQPQIDFDGVDAFFELCRRYGFDRPINGYGGLRFLGLHDGYQRGEAAARVTQESGLDYETAFMRAWDAVDRHARQAGWPTIYYAMCDETRVRDVAERELDFMKLMAQVTAQFPKTVRSSGSYSVDFRDRPTDGEDLKTWHQRFFEALDISSLNVHDETVIAEARALGKEVHIYNQGQTRYSFGLYQWNEFTKGVRARWQWHLNVLHGYQFFDLDGREPDTAMICYGSRGIYPTIHFERCREGAEDFYLYQTLAHAIERRSAAGQTEREATELLTRLTDGMQLNQTTPPDGYNPDATKLEVIEALERLR
ncbi:MAG TPA: hypothetical protein PLD23_06820 [Armatimonadota bacterium]|nr:hypothetical protein [Armatimonadota bacterium]